MLRLVVTASGTPADRRKHCTYIAKSASDIMVAPDSVPPGRSVLASNGCRKKAAAMQSSSISQPFMALDISGNSARKRSVSSLRVHFRRRHLLAHAELPSASILRYNGPETTAKIRKKLDRPMNARTATAAAAATSPSLILPARGPCRHCRADAEPAPGPQQPVGGDA